MSQRISISIFSDYYIYSRNKIYYNIKLKQLEMFENKSLSRYSGQYPDMNRSSVEFTGFANVEALHHSLVTIQVDSMYTG